jgi:hypothetical protein
VEKVLKCDCGFEARAQDEEELVEAVRRHARDAHGMALSPDEAVFLAFRAELDSRAFLAISLHSPVREERKEER